MNKRISAAFVIMLFVLGIVATPVSAHFTLGDLTGTYPYRENDYDPHVDSVTGVIGYVFPGAGPQPSAAYAAAGVGPGAPAPAAEFPGYQPPYPASDDADGDTPRGPSGFSTSWYQLDSTYYAPFGAILTSTLKAGTPFNKMKVSGNPTIETAGTWVDGAAMTLEHANKGDLIFAFNATADYTKGSYVLGRPSGGFAKVSIQIPPEFTGITRTKIVTSWTNNYDLITSGTNDMEDANAPGWTGLTLYADPHFSLVFTERHEWYYVRINDVTAPTIAGRYFFKIFMDDAPDASDHAPPVPDECPPQNWPVLLVKGEVDPGIITGTIRYGGWVPTLYGDEAEIPGMVRAVGIADDPYTFKSTGRPVEARAYFNHTANGHYEIEGVAPGTYDVYASLAGYPEIKIASGVKVLKGQSAHVDGYLTPGVVIHGQVFSKCGTGEVNWKCGDYDNLIWDADGTQQIKIEIYRSLADAQATLPASSSTKAISWSPSSQGEKVFRQFAWPDYTNGPDGYDPDGVGPSQLWVVSNARADFVFQFGEKGHYGVPALWTGHIPQTFATWADGVGAGTFWVRAWTHGYVQTLMDGVTFAPVTFTVASVEWPGDVFIPFDLMLGSWIVKEFHFHNIPGTLMDNGWDLPDILPRSASLYVDVKDAAGKTVGWAVRTFARTDLEPADYKAVGVRGLLGRSPYWRSYGMLAGTYIVKGYAAGYLDQKPTTVSVGLCGTEVHFSDHLDKGAQFDIAVYSVDWQHPSVQKNWVWPTSNIYIQIFKEGKPLCTDKLYDDGMYPYLDGERKWGGGATGIPVVWGMPVPFQHPDDNHVSVVGYYGDEAYYESTDRPGYYPLAFETGTYSFKAFTYGYVQKKPFTVYVVKGARADIPIKLHVGANVTFDIVFKRESIIDHLRYDSAVRVRLFNDAGVLVGEALTSDYTKAYANAPNTDPEEYWTGAVVTAQLNPLSDYTVYDDPEYINYIPSCTTRLRGLIAGLPDLAYGGADFRGVPWFNVFNEKSPDPYFDMLWTGDPIPAPYGIDAAPNYKGGWYIEVDVVPWYRNSPPEAIPVYGRGAGGGVSHYTVYYPPPPGLLTGESPKYIPENHWGPYEQRRKVVVPGAHLGGEASVIFELDLRALFSGNVYTYTHCDDWRTTSWILVQATAADGKIYNWYTFDGAYEAWLTPGAYAVNVIVWAPAGQGYKVATVPSLTVTEGGNPTMNFYMEQSGIPIPEFATTALVLASALAASLFILRRRKK